MLALNTIKHFFSAVWLHLSRNPAWCFPYLPIPKFRSILFSVTMLLTKSGWFGRTTAVYSAIRFDMFSFLCHIRIHVNETLYGYSVTYGHWLKLELYLAYGSCRKRFWHLCLFSQNSALSLNISRHECFSHQFPGWISLSHNLVHINWSRLS